MTFPARNIANIHGQDSRIAYPQLESLLHHELLFAKKDWRSALKRFAQNASSLALFLVFGVSARAVEQEVLHFKAGLDWLILKNFERHNVVNAEDQRREISTIALGDLSATSPQETSTPAYPQTAEGLASQFSAALDAYKQGNSTEGRHVLEQFRLPRPVDWFGEQIRPELNEILAKRYNRLFEQFLNQTENMLLDLAHNKGQKLRIDLKPARQEPPGPSNNLGATSRIPSGIVTVKKPVTFDAFFSVNFTSKSHTIFTGDYRATYWEATYVYQDGAFRFVGSGAWPFWEWEDDYDHPSPTGPYVPTPIDLASPTVDEVIPFQLAKVAPALKAAMESQNCELKESDSARMECKRPRNYSNSQRGSSGGESVTALLEPQGDKTRVRISTGKGFYGRLVKQNWSVPIYLQMIKNLRQASQNPEAAPKPSPSPGTR